MIDLVYPRVLSIIEKENLQQKAAVFYDDMLRAERYIFRTFGDVDEPTVKAIHSTAEEMIGAGFYHLPHRICWIEDPWERDAGVDTMAKELGVDLDEVYRRAPYLKTFNERSRQLYLAVEEPSRIRLYGATATPQAMEPGAPLGVVFHSTPRIIDLSPARRPLEWTETFNSMQHALNQFIVTLATKQAVLDRVPGKPWKPKQPISTRQYGHTVVSVRVPGARDAGVVGEGGKRRLHLVAGYTWGRHTRPVEQQRWINPFWRGDAELGAVVRDHYEVRS